MLASLLLIPSYLMAYSLPHSLYSSHHFLIIPIIFLLFYTKYYSQSLLHKEIIPNRDLNIFILAYSLSILSSIHFKIFFSKTTHLLLFEVVYIILVHATNLHI
jgi:hypothetical protein